jgi:antitoxin component YwqK of YwqJK toxin-antitoxin module
LEAQAAAQALLAAGVPYLIAADNCGGAFPALEIYRGIQLRVRHRDLQRAQEILTDFEAEKPEVDAETAERAAATPSAFAEPGSGPAGWSAGQKARLWFLAGLGLGVAITTAILIDGDTSSRSSYTGVTEDDADGDGKTDRWVHYRRGQVQRDETDHNYDGKPDTWYFLEDGKVVRYEADFNFDGKVDAWAKYSDGRVARSSTDRDFDGQPDRWTYYRDGVAEREEWDRNGDGKPDAWSYFSAGMTARHEEDQNFDGRVDLWLECLHDLPATSRVDTDFNGQPDVTYHFSRGVTFRADWVDQHSGKLWKRASFRNGYILEELIDTDRDGTFDTKITYDAFENPIQTVKLE